ncbi:unnamed protein product [Vitrella brassicaformis CCMP3155]|uniref:Protein kinase domain-containing protein n=1 Tax=Vitrella brassicaformis (strain CCMP3155) TaxID=1169540 RepID=A0A0G4EYG5_VITBC|nr:unnamed protein product [Vitrella brassicaformis CCMP3155]|eukprot:CEM03490.1 unnamed protein product [Vitrella brassicaformis CCMP3155]
MRGVIQRTFAPVRLDLAAYPHLRPGGPTEADHAAAERKSRKWMADGGLSEEQIAERLEKRRREGALQQKWEGHREFEAAKAAVEHQYGLIVEGRGRMGGQAHLWRSGRYMIKVFSRDFSLGGPRYTPTHTIYTTEGLSRCPQICRYYDSFTTSGRTVTIMEHIDGKTLSACEPLGEEAAKTYMKGVFTALAYLHGKGVHYYDVKPDNFMVFPCGAVKMIDLDMIDYDNAGRSGAREDVEKAGRMLQGLLKPNVSPSPELQDLFDHISRGQMTSAEILAHPWLRGTHLPTPPPSPPPPQHQLRLVKEETVAQAPQPPTHLRPGEQQQGHTQATRSSQSQRKQHKKKDRNPPSQHTSLANSVKPSQQHQQQGKDNGGTQETMVERKGGGGEGHFTPPTAPRHHHHLNPSSRPSSPTPGLKGQGGKFDECVEAIDSKAKGGKWEGVIEAFYRLRLTEKLHLTSSALTQLQRRTPPGSPFSHRAS